ncbi:hypothetical protein [Mycoplasmopsis primatum]|uniref:hypothetical protein n=1 Tax=Mycoplasmopsis primatum TaxID=55604 RepID=UPI0004957937|nr:hypothetical protein [Mycoplasmopsis primatum]
MNNKEYFLYSQNNIDGAIDKFKQKGKLVISENANQEPTSLMKSNSQLVEFITTYKILSENSVKSDELINTIIDKIINIIETTDMINYSSFCTYWQVVGYSYSTFVDKKSKLTQNKKREIIRNLLDLYIKNRHNIYLYHGYSDQCLQVQSDAATSRRKGKTGIEMMETLLTKLNFIKTNTYADFHNSQFCYMLPDKDGINLFNEFLVKNNIQFTFRTSWDNKNPDMLIKIFNDYFIIEHKLTNGFGGAQNSEINEIIQFISHSENSNNLHYVSCLQGDYFQKLNNMEKCNPKVKTQYENIIKNLNKHRHNFFVNGVGFNKLILDFVNRKN